eukprot:CAMPEP_0117041550 /NCGR_PEP_ID=MMETSP0472-20121206/29005_1 /TAXON_ID=693140 ORGANISM="Tiarina fusus, Strain LIS" /NCGR_SAMPLE_ID=MMETSP0472 /ASSEMBLY_ACC=CAM_ASM_000603 /LENGTH=482 /DNA_ID=CAMNT_0004752581 /DNA_START=12 /DNA_END=1458 /DNA_ORIENTATION=-
MSRWSLALALFALCGVALASEVFESSDTTLAFSDDAPEEVQADADVDLDIDEVDDDADDIEMSIAIKNLDDCPSSKCRKLRGKCAKTAAGKRACKKQLKRAGKSAGSCGSKKSSRCKKARARLQALRDKYGRLSKRMRRYLSMAKSIAWGPKHHHVRVPGGLFKHRYTRRIKNKRILHGRRHSAKAPRGARGRRVASPKPKGKKFWGKKLPRKTRQLGQKRRFFSVKVDRNRKNTWNRLVKPLETKRAPKKKGYWRKFGKKVLRKPKARPPRKGGRRLTRGVRKSRKRGRLWWMQRQNKAQIRKRSERSGGRKRGVTRKHKRARRTRWNRFRRFVKKGWKRRRPKHIRRSKASRRRSKLKKKLRNRKPTRKRNWLRAGIFGKKKKKKTLMQKLRGARRKRWLRFNRLFAARKRAMARKAARRKAAAALGSPAAAGSTPPATSASPLCAARAGTAGSAQSASSISAAPATGVNLPYSNTEEDK